MKELIIKAAWSEDSETLVNWAIALPDLVSLHLTYVPFKNFKINKELMPKLKNLSYNYCNSQSPEQIFDVNCPDLQDLVINSDVDET